MSQVKTMKWLAPVVRLCLVLVCVAAPACMSGSNPTPHPGQTDPTSSGEMGTGDNASGSDPTDGDLDDERSPGGAMAGSVTADAAMPRSDVTEFGGADVVTSDVGPDVEDIRSD